MSPSPEDPPERHPPWPAGAGLEGDAAAMRAAVAALGAADRHRALRLIDQSLAWLAPAVTAVQSEYAARRDATARLSGDELTADQHLERYDRHFGAEHGERIRARSRFLQDRAKDDKGWLEEKRAEHREPLPSATYLRQVFGQPIEDHEPLAALGVALRSAERDAEAAVAPRGRRGRPSARSSPSSRRASADRSQSQLDRQMLRLLGPHYVEVDQLASLLGGPAGARSDEWIKARREGFRKGLELPFLEATEELLLLENELDRARGEEKGAAERLEDLSKKRLLEIAKDRDLRGRTRMSMEQLVTALTGSPSTGRDAPDQERPGAVIEERIEALRTTWVEQHGALAAVYLHAEREDRRREPERAARRRESLSSFSVDATFAAAAPLLGEARARAIEQLTARRREEFAAWKTGDLEEERLRLGDPLRHFDRSGAREAIPRELERKRIAGGLGLRERIGASDKAPIQGKLATDLRRKLAAWERAEAPLRSQPPHPDRFMAKHGASLADARAIEAVLGQRGLEIPGPELPVSAPASEPALVSTPAPRAGMDLS